MPVFRAAATETARAAKDTAQQLPKGAPKTTREAKRGARQAKRKAKVVARQTKRVIKRKAPKVKIKVKELGRRKASRTTTKRTMVTKVTTRGKKGQGRKKRRNIHHKTIRTTTTI